MACLTPQSSVSVKYWMVLLLCISCQLIQSKLFLNMLTKSLSPSCNNCSKLAGLTACGIGIYSIKEARREHRGHGTHTKVSQQTKMPKKWSDFLRVVKNKQELISLLTTKVAEMTVPEEKRIYITSGKFSVL